MNSRVIIYSKSNRLLELGVHFIARNLIMIKLCLAILHCAIIWSLLTTCSGNEIFALVIIKRVRIIFLEID